jgi:type II secretory pathway pseudopilin PulG
MRKMTIHTPVRGYSLAELIVAVGIFSMVMLIVMGVYLALISYDRQARATNQLASNFSFAVESMVRNIRTGTGYPSGCSTTPCTSFSFTDSQGRSVSYALSGGQLIATTGGLSAPLTDPAITITNLRFYVRGVGTTGAEAVRQPTALILIAGSMPAGSGKVVDFTIETAATQRLLELP